MDWNAIALEIGLLALAVLVLAWDLIVGRAAGRARRGHYIIGTAGLAALFAWSFTLPTGVSFTAALVQDGFALFIKQVLLAAGLLATLAACPYADRRGWSSRSGEFLVLLFFAMIGGMALVSAQEFLTLFVAFELLSLPIYSLAAIEKNRPESPEGAMKIFLFGSVSSAMLLLGLGLLFASAGTTFWHQMPESLPHASLMGLGLLLLLSGFGFKIAMFPFYMWVPDTYEAAPSPIVAFLSVAPKAAGIATLFRLYFELFEGTANITVWVGILAALTMIAGNLLALPQQNLKRLLAYSGVAQIGYVLLAVAAGSRFGAGMALFFFVAYLFSNMGAFLSVAALEAAGQEPTLAGARNLIRRSPVLAGSFLAFLLSLGGIPFALGFWGKLQVFRMAAGRAGLWWLVFLGAVLAVVALYYYLNVARWMFIVEEDGPDFKVPAALLVAILICAIVVVAGGLVPNLFVAPALEAVSGL